MPFLPSLSPFAADRRGGGMSWWQWALIGVVVLAVANGLVLAWGSRHAQRDPREASEDYVPEDWLFPPRVEDESTVRHGGLGR